MKILLDENVPLSYFEKLKKIGYNVEHVSKKHSGKKDKDIFNYAVKNKKIIITFDADFCNFRKSKHYGIIKVSAKMQNNFEILLKLLKKIENENTEDIYYEISPNKMYRESKIFSKRTNKFKQFTKMPIIIE